MSTQALKVPGPHGFRLFSRGEVLWTEFKGDVLVSIFEEGKTRGGCVQLRRLQLEADFSFWWDQVKKLNLSNPQIKAIALKGDEEKIRSLVAAVGTKLANLVTFGPGERLECVFYVASGRLRVAPIETTVVSASGSSASAAVTPIASRAATVHHSKLKVLIVDDSSTMRQILRRILSASPDLDVVGEAERPSQVEALIEKLKPDVMTLDINMPEMSGVELLKIVLKQQFIPTVMISSLNINDGNEVLNALEIGAVDYIQKPSASEISAMSTMIQEKIAGAARARRQLMTPAEAAPTSRLIAASPGFSSLPLLAVGASTGGTEAIKNVFVNFPASVPPIVVVQHIPPYFSTAFAARLNDLCQFEVKEASDGDEVRPGRALIAPGGLHMKIVQEKGKLIARVFDAEPVNRFKPSVDVLFDSVAQVLGGKATGVLLTGMGSDGAKGLLAMKKAGSFTITQDEETSVVYGMPRAAFEIGASTVVQPLHEIARTLMSRRAA